MGTTYDAIVVGARCAGSPTAMLLARKGYRVLVVDRAGFPSDTLSTLVIQPQGVAALRRWGLLDEVLATGCPWIERYSFDFGPVTIGGTSRPVGGGSAGCAPRRYLLDKILVDAAARAGAEVRERFNVDGLEVEDGTVTGIRGHGEDGTPVVERARVVIGADGRNSHVARWVDAPRYHEKPRLAYAYYAFYSDLPTDGFEVIIRPDRGWGVIPTNDGLTLAVMGWPHAEAQEFKADVEAGFAKTVELAPDFADRFRAATRVEPFLGGAVENFFRNPAGPGWALVGDAGYNKDPITAQGISDAFRDAELCSTAIDEWLGGKRPYDEAMADYQTTRDEHVFPMYEFTTQLATLQPPPPEMQQLLGAIQGNQEAMDDFISMQVGTLSPADFFDPANLGRLMAQPAQ
jgi:2-polyprenyl-6-methoxyphenol hydroxylase-like FAD-dependent oxidoreductase